MRTKLGQLLVALTPSEMRELQRFLQSSFLNPRPEVLPLLGFFRKELKEGREPDRLEIARELFPEEEVSDAHIRRLMSYLVKGIEKYLIWQEMTANPLTTDLHLLRAYRRRHLAKGFQSVAARIEKELVDKGTGDENFHFNCYTYHLEQYNFSANRAGKEPPNLTAILQELDYFYIVNKLKQACNTLNHQRLFKYQYDLPLLEALLDHIRTAELQRIPAIRVYYQSYMTLVSEEEGHFYSLKESIHDHIHLFDEQDRRSIFMLAINFCIRQLNQGRDGYLREVFELYKKALEEGILLENGQLSHWTYKNIVSAALKLEEFGWIEGFLEEYRSLLAPKIRPSSYAYNKAKLFFARENYREALRMLLPIGFDDLFTQLDARVLTIKCYFELGELDAVEYQLDSFRHLLRRKELLAYHKEHYRNFIDFSWSLIRQKDQDILRREILDREGLAEKEWLLRQLNAR